MSTPIPITLLYTMYAIAILTSEKNNLNELKQSANNH